MEGSRTMECAFWPPIQSVPPDVSANSRSPLRRWQSSLCLGRVGRVSTYPLGQVDHPRVCLEMVANLLPIPRWFGFRPGGHLWTWRPAGTLVRQSKREARDRSYRDAIGKSLREPSQKVHEFNELYPDGVFATHQGKKTILRANSARNSSRVCSGLRMTRSR